jgi:hypothetical protein
MNAGRFVLAVAVTIAALLVASAGNAVAASNPWSAHRSVDGARTRDAQGDNGGQNVATPDSVRGSDNSRAQEARPTPRADENAARAPRVTERPAATERPAITHRALPEATVSHRESETARETRVSRPETADSARSSSDGRSSVFRSSDTATRTDVAPKGDLKIDSGRVVREGSTSTSRGSTIFSSRGASREGRVASTTDRSSSGAAEPLTRITDSGRGASEPIQRGRVTATTPSRLPGSDTSDRGAVAGSPRRLPGAPTTITGGRSTVSADAGRSDRLQSIRHSEVGPKLTPTPVHRVPVERTVASRESYHPERHVATSSFSFQGTIVTNNFAVGVNYGHPRPACIPVWHQPVIYRPVYCPIVYHPHYYHPIICQPVIVRPWWTCCTPTWYWPYNGWSVGYHGRKWSIFISDIWPTRTYVETVYVTSPVVETVVVDPAPVRVIEPYDSIDRLIDRLKYGDVDARKDAAQELGRSHSYKAMYPLIYAVEYDSEPLVRHYAAKALGKLGYRDALPALRKVADQDQEEVVRAEAQDAIDRILDRQT